MASARDAEAGRARTKRHAQRKPALVANQKMDAVGLDFGGEAAARFLAFASRCLHHDVFGLYSTIGGSGHSSHSVNYTIPTALSQDSHAVILKIPEPIRSA